MSTSYDPEKDDAERERAEREQAVFDLARSGADDDLAARLDDGVPVGLADAQGNSLLMLAAYNGHPSTVRLLAGRGADVDQVNERGQTPLAGAVFKGDAEVVRVLLSVGADPRAGTPNAYDTARMFQQFALLEELEASGGPA